MLNASEIDRDILQTSERAPVELLRKLFLDSENDLKPTYDYHDDSHKDRFCDWEGRSKDGRKHGNKSEPAFPWEGASDMRTWNIDDITNKIVSVYSMAVSSSRISATISDKADPIAVGAAEQFMNWYFNKGMPSSKRNLNLAAQWGVSFGISAIGVYWEEKIIKTPSTFSLKDVEGSSFISEYLSGEEVEPSDKAINDAINISGLNEKKEAVKFLKSIKASGYGRGMREVIGTSEARLKALRVGRDIFFPKNIEDIEDAPFVFTVEYLAPNQLRARALAENWKPGFVDRVLEHNKKGFNEIRSSASEALSDKYEDWRVRIVRSYYWAHDNSDSQTLRYCVFCPDDEDNLYAVSGVMEPQRYPFVLYAFENVESEIIDARGVSEIAIGWQREIKTQKDLRIDNASIAINPPKVFRVGNKPDTNYAPAALIPVKGGDFKILENLNISGNPAASIEVEASVKREMYDYFGNPCVSSENSASGLQLQFMVSGWLDFVGKVLGLVFEYCREYRLDSFRFKPEEASSGEIVEYSPEIMPQGLEFTLGFDVRDLDLTFYLKKFDLAAKYISTYDRNGDTNTSRLLRMVMSRLFPNDAPELISAPEESSKREILETQADLAAIFSLQPVNAPEHCNARLRLQIISEYAQKPSIIGRMGVDKEFAEALQNYTKQLQFQVQQYEVNAQIGRIGTAPASGLPQDIEGGEYGSV